MWDEVCMFERCDYSSMTSPALSNVYSGMRLLLKERGSEMDERATDGNESRTRTETGCFGAWLHLACVTSTSDLRCAFQRGDENRSVSVNTESSCSDSALISDGPVVQCVLSLSFSDAGQVKLHPNLFLLLLVLGRLYPSPMDGSSSPLGLASFKPLIIRLEYKCYQYYFLFLLCSHTTVKSNHYHDAYTVPFLKEFQCSNKKHKTIITIKRCFKQKSIHGKSESSSPDHLKAICSWHNKSAWSVLLELLFPQSIKVTLSSCNVCVIVKEDSSH